MREIQRNIVGAVLLTQDNKILLGKQDKGGVWDDCWHIPGGGIEEGESLEEALKREVLEETQIDISSWSTKLVSDQNSNKAEKILKETGEKVIVNMTFYDYLITTDKLSTEIELIKKGDGFSQLKWFDVSELKDLKLTPSEIVLFEKLKML
jgi:nucleoside triphosphatase